MTRTNWKICHLSTIHPINDIRIFHKECRALSAAGYDTHFVTSGNFGDIVEEGVQIHGVNSHYRPRLKRFTLTAFRVYRRALQLDCDLYHIHSIDLLPYVWALKAHGKRVIYDVHEDQPRQTGSREFIPKSLRGLVGSAIEWLETKVARKVDGLVAATPYIRDRFLKLSSRCISATNYPVKDDFLAAPVRKAKSAKEFIACYVGSMTRVRGLIEMIQSCEQAQMKMLIAGGMDDKLFEAAKKQKWYHSHVENRGLVNRDAVLDIFTQSDVGFVLYHPEPNHVNAVPNKMFEYMAASLPIIVSNFPSWMKVIQEERCGFAVDPMKPQEVAQALKFLRDNPEEAKAMGERGRKAVMEKYTWDSEAERLVEFYDQLFQIKKSIARNFVTPSPNHTENLAKPVEIMIPVTSSKASQQISSPGFAE